MGFWDDQINELLTGIRELLGDGGVPQQPAALAPGPSPAANPGETGAAGFTGRGAGEARSADASLTRNARALAQADQELDQRVSDTDAAHVRARQRLVSLDDEIRGGVARLQPWLDSAAGQAELGAFLSAKTQQVQAVIRDATAASETNAAAVRGLGETNEQVRTTGI